MFLMSSFRSTRYDVLVDRALAGSTSIVLALTVGSLISTRLAVVDRSSSTTDVESTEVGSMLYVNTARIVGVRLMSPSYLPGETECSCGAGMCHPDG